MKIPQLAQEYIILWALYRPFRGAEDTALLFTRLLCIKLVYTQVKQCEQNTAGVF
jgi:hypothetical protein